MTNATNATNTTNMTGTTYSPMPEGIHLLGFANFQNKRSRLFGQFNDQEFIDFLTCHDNKLPDGVLVWHLTNDEIRNGSKRIDAINDLPLVCYGNGVPVSIKHVDFVLEYMRIKDHLKDDEAVMNQGAIS